MPEQRGQWPHCSREFSSCLRYAMFCPFSWYKGLLLSLRAGLHSFSIHPEPIYSSRLAVSCVVVTASGVKHLGPY